MAEPVTNIAKLFASRQLTINDLRTDPDLMQAARDCLNYACPDLEIDTEDFTEKILADLDVQEVIES